ncbi:hypothetical protein BKA70DRAFT_852273 [Coprinopsis sp. MPI-PUGE-AT-0042]|nr:hypothetical protein BKA70DRAFT_852273 [Coprinopsis sp. MPI-PUGE-AT-0042]
MSTRGSAAGSRSVSRSRAPTPNNVRGRPAARPTTNIRTRSNSRASEAQPLASARPAQSPIVEESNNGSSTVIADIAQRINTAQADSLPTFAPPSSGSVILDIPQPTLSMSSQPVDLSAAGRSPSFANRPTSYRRGKEFVLPSLDESHSGSFGPNPAHGGHVDPYHSSRMPAQGGRVGHNPYPSFPPAPAPPAPPPPQGGYPHPYGHHYPYYGGGMASFPPPFYGGGPSFGYGAPAPYLILLSDRLKIPIHKS